MTELERRIIDLARRVREAQKCYYAGRQSAGSSARLNASMKLERLLDDALDAHDSGRPLSMQAGLFDGAREVTE